MNKQVLALVLLCGLFFISSSARAVDSFSAMTGMIDSPYYKYEFRGLSNASLQLSQSLFEGGATQARIAMAKARLTSSRHLLAEAATSLVFDAISAHVGILRHSRLVELARQNRDDYADTIKMLNGRVENGLSTPGDISLVQSRLQRAEGILAEYNSDLLAAKAQFERVTGKPAPQALGDVTMPAKTYKSVAMLLDACMERNPRLLAERENINIAEGQEKLANSGNFPTIGISGGPRWHLQNTPQDSRNHGWDAMVSLQWNLFDGGATQSQRREAAAQKRQARHNTQDIADQLKSDIFSTWAQYEAAAERMKAYEKSMNTATEARLIFYAQYLLGTKGLLDLLDADNEYFISAAQYTIARWDRILAAYRLLALGGDLLATMKINPEKQGKK